MGRNFVQLMPDDRILAEHINSLRTYVNADAALLPPNYRYPFLWMSVNSGDRILAKHLTDLRAAIELLWEFKARGDFPDWSSGVAPGGPSNQSAPTPVRASDITDLRRWLNQYEDNHPSKAQGIDSYSYRPDAPNNYNPVIQNDWAQDIANFSTKRLLVRSNVVAPLGSEGTRDNFTSFAISRFKDAFYRYRSRGVVPFAVFTNEFFNPGSSSIHDEIDLDPASSNFFTNAYIRGFSQRATAGCASGEPFVKLWV